MEEALQKTLISDLVQESSEALDQFGGDLVSREAGTSDDETLHRIFRAIH